MAAQLSLFDAKAGRALRDDDIDRAVAKRRHNLNVARQVAADIAISTDRTCTADQVQEVILRMGIDLGNAAGGIFKGGCWRWTGRIENSARTSNRSRIIRVWEYVP